MVLIYLFVMIEKVGSLLMFGWLAFWIGVLLLILSAIVSAMKADTWSWEPDTTFKEQWETHGFVKICKKVSKWLTPIGLIVGTLGFLTPSQKDAAIIVGSSLTYNVLTSETGKRIGGKAVDLLEKKIDEALKSPEVKEAPKVEGKAL
jgi:hypothetical protein